MGRKRYVLSNAKKMMDKYYKYKFSAADIVVVDSNGTPGDILRGCLPLYHAEGLVKAVDPLSGIIVNTALYCINIAVLGGSSLLNMNKTDTVFTFLRDALKGTPLAGQSTLLAALIAVVCTVAFLVLFLNTRLGLSIRATGDNPEMVRASSINPMFTTTVGLCVANAFTGLSGCLLAQAQKQVDINLGQGMVTIALASLLIGRAFLGKGSILTRAVGVVLGAFLFRLVYAIALRFDMPAFLLKLVSSVIVIFAIAGPYLKSRWPEVRRRIMHRFAARKGGT